jgi:N-acetylmuramoyl-L-alanine amidase
MRAKRYCWSTFAGLALMIPSCFGAPADGAAVTAVRFWTLNDATRVVIETTGEFNFTSDRAQSPDRIFFDIKGARLRLGPSKGQHTVPVGDGLVKQIRVAETQPGVTRVVFDLDSAAEFTASQLSNPSRLIVELRAGLSVPSAPSVATLPPAAAKLPPPPVLAKATERVENVKPPLKAPKAASLPSGSGSMTRVLGLKVGRIVLDAGHGGHDTGTIGPTGLYEKDLVLDVVKRLGALIESALGCRSSLHAFGRHIHWVGAAHSDRERASSGFVPVDTREFLARREQFGCRDVLLELHDIEGSDAGSRP